MPGATPFDRALSGEVPLVWLYAHGAKLAGEDVAELGRNPGALTRSLEACVDVFGVPVVAPAFDTGFENRAVRNSLVGGEAIAAPEDAFDVVAEEVLADGRIETILEATERLTTTLEDASVIGTLTEPRTLVEGLVATDAPETLEETWFLVEDVQIALANAYLDRGVDGLMILPSTGFRADPREAAALRALANVAEHFDSTTLAFVEDLDEESVRFASNVGFDALAAPTGVDEPRVPDDRSLGLALPADEFRNGRVDRVRANLPPEVFVTSEAPLPADVPPEAIHDVMD